MAVAAERRLIHGDPDHSLDRAPHDASPEGELVPLFEAQREAFRKNPYPPYAERIAMLEALEAMVKKYRPKAEEALAADSRADPPQLTAVCELMRPIERARFARANLKRWMKPQARRASRFLYGLARRTSCTSPRASSGTCPRGTSPSTSRWGRSPTSWRRGAGPS